MKYVAAGLTAFVVFLVGYYLPSLLKEPVLNLIGWDETGLPGDMKWWRTGVGLVIAACAFRLYIDWRNTVALKWRKTLASRARA